ncbi:MAG: hypothetical protein PHP31_00925 [Lentimicrobiaceae bacterium]|nr:hypothetical protein [Lentimicrobiaceae bacterium]
MENKLDVPKKEKNKSKLGRKVKRFFVFVLIFLVLIGAGYTYWKYFFVYSKGNRTGILQKFSNKGTLFKTYEGEMNLISIRELNSLNPNYEKFMFSVVNDSVASEVNKLQGEHVVVRYKEYKGVLPWRGNSKFIVDSIGIAQPYSSAPNSKNIMKY